MACQVKSKVNWNPLKEWPTGGIPVKMALIQLLEMCFEYLNGSSEGPSKRIRKEAVDNGTDLDALGFTEIK